MMKYGIDNVRGGSYTKLKLDDWMVKSLEHEFISAQDICYNCNKKGHFTKDCRMDKRYNIKKYLESFKDIRIIDGEIKKLEYLYEQIIILNTQITQCDIIEKMSVRQVSEYNGAIQNWYKQHNYPRHKIYNRYHDIYNHLEDIYIESMDNIDIKKYKFKIFHLERKKELKDIFDIHISEELIKMKLSGLFEMKISMLTRET